MDKELRPKLGEFELMAYAVLAFSLLTGGTLLVALLVGLFK